MMRECARRTLRFIAVVLGAVPVLVLSAPAAAAQSCQNELLRTELHSGELADCRAYEMVTPPYKEGDDVHMWAISPDGSRLLGTSFGAFDGTESDEFQAAGEAAAYMFTRGSSGWSATPISPPASQFPSSRLAAISPELTRTLWLLRTPAQPNAQEAGFYLRTESGQFVPIGPTQAVSGETAEVEYSGAAKSLSRVLFTIDASANDGAYLWPGDETASYSTAVPSLYEYTGTDNSEPVLVGIRNKGKLEGSPHVNEGAELVSQCGTLLGGNGSAYNAISASGATVFFTAVGLTNGEGKACELGPGGSAPPADELYARFEGSETLAISEPSSSACEACNTAGVSSAGFQGASEDGSKVFFATTQALLPGASGENLYEYEINRTVNERGEVEYTCPERPDGCVTLVSSGSSAPELKGVVRISEDGSHVYFVAGGALAGINAEGHAPVKGEDNFYVYDTLTGTTRFIGALASDDQALWGPKDRYRPVESTSDGEFLIFTSSADLTAGDTSTVDQVFEYDAHTEQLRRVSVGQEGYNDDGNSTEASDAARIGVETALANYMQGIEATKKAAMRALSEDGSRVFFESADALTPQTLTGLPDNVYEWEREGAGSCAVGETEGCVYLISDGRDDASTNFEGPSVRLVGIDASGDDAFFTTADQLVPRDTDTQLDVYDARIGGGFAEPGTLSECDGSACQGPLDLESAAGPIATATSEDEPPVSTPAKPTTTDKPAALTRAQQLVRALKSCRTVKRRARRQTCEAQARRRYGPRAKKSGAHEAGAR
jgi:hypothetical protein